MTDQDDELADAADILRAHGRTVEPHVDGEDHHRWLLNGMLILSEGQLRRHAARLGLREGPERAQ